MRRSVMFSKMVPIKHECDVMVAGGGIAGVCAAISAARSGASVLLAERFAVTGGNATVGGVGAFCGETAGQGEVFDEIVAALESFGAIAPYKPYPEMEARLFDREVLAFVLQELLLKSGVKLLLHSKVCAVEGTPGRNVSVCALAGASGLEAVRAKQHVDATGDGLLSDLAGFETMKGRDGDGAQLPMSLMFFVRHFRDPAQASGGVLPDGWLERIDSQEDLPMVSVWPDGDGGNAIKLKICGGDSTNSASLSDAEVRARRRTFQVMDYFRRVEGKPWLLKGISPIIGIREGRRVAGEYVLTVEDLRAGRRFDDAVARGVFYLDGHSPDDDKRTYILPKDQLQVPPYQIPMRSLMAKGAENLTVAGRCLSACQLALSSARVMPTCAMMGQAAGAATALAADRNVSLDSLDLLEIRRIVEERGARLDV